LNSIQPKSNDPNVLGNGGTTVALPFEYSLERIIDDFILLAVFVGNDFLPHLPDLHIHDNAFEVLFEKYRETLPKAGTCIHCYVLFFCALMDFFFGIGGYINEHGKINLPRLQIFLDALSTFEQEAYEKEHSDMNWFKSKQRPKELAQLEEKGIKGAFSMFPSLSLRIFFLFMA
jgi:5'-3' exoribonuclease 1